MTGLLRAIAREVFALFVDDGLFAAGIVAWVAILALIARQGAADQAWVGALLFAGLAVLLVASAWQRARR